VLAKAIVCYSRTLRKKLKQYSELPGFF